MARRVVAIVQAGTASSRFRGRFLKRFGESTVLEQVLRRLSRGVALSEIWVATTTDPMDDRVAEIAAREGVRCVRGSSKDMLQTVVSCLDGMTSMPDLVVRVGGEQAFVCTQLLAEMLEFYDRVGQPDYLSNNRPRSFPVGLDLEIMRPSALYESRSSNPSGVARRDVTPYIYRHPKKFSLSNWSCPFGNFSAARMAVTTSLDYETLGLVHAALTAIRFEYDYRDILNLITLEPGLFGLDHRNEEIEIA